MATSDTTRQYYISQSDKYNSFDDVAREYLDKKLKATQYVDFGVKFNKNPNTNDLAVLRGDNAVRQSIKNLIRTNRFERYMRPDVGCDLTKLLFEPSNQITEIRIKELISETIKNHEKRAILKNIDVKSVRDGLCYDITIVFAIKGSDKPVTFTTFLETNQG